MSCDVRQRAAKHCTIAIRTVVDCTKWNIGDEEYAENIWTGYFCLFFTSTLWMVPGIAASKAWLTLLLRSAVSPMK